MIQLFQFPAIWDLPNASPFCVKMETYLRLCKIPYQVKSVRDPRRAPKGKLPFIKDGDKTIADSSLIIDYLKQTYGDKLDAQLTETQKATALAVQRMLEEHLYWLLFHSRWVNLSSWSTIKNDFFQEMPVPFRWFVPDMLRKQMIKVLHGQGAGRFNDEERFQLFKKDIDTIVSLKGNNSYFFGEEPTSIDCTLWAFITNLINVPVKNDLQDYVKSISSLVDYDSRMRSRFDELISIKMNET